MHLTFALALFLIVLNSGSDYSNNYFPCVFLTFYRLCVGIGVGEVGADAQGAAVGAGLDAGRLEQQRFPGGAVPQSHHLPRAAAGL